MAYLIAAVDGIYINSSLVVGSSFEPDGELGDWITDDTNGEIYVVADEEFVYDGTYGARLATSSDYEFSAAAIIYELSGCASTDVINVSYRIIEADGTSGEEDSAIFYIYAFDSYENESPSAVLLSYGYEDTPVTEPLAWASATIDISELDVESGITICAYTVSFTSGGGGGGGDNASATIYFDDFTLTEGASWDGFKNGDFELGTLENWTIIGSASIDTSIVHNGSYSCLLPANDDINGIKQRIDLTDTEQLNIFYNIPSNTGYAYFTILDLGGDYVLWNRDQYTTPGWVCHTLDVSELTGEYVLFIYSYNCTLYVDDISTQESFSTSLQYGTFNYGTWFTPSAEQFSKYCKYPPTSGEDSSRCLNLNPVWNYSPYTSSAYSYCNLTEVNSISLKYRIPEFDKGYAGMGGAWLKIKLEGDTTETHTIATATVGGSIPDWTTYSVDTSHLTGLYKVTVFGQVTDARYTLHPTLNAYIDNILANINISLITELCLYQYIDDDLITDIGHDVFETTDTGSRRISHRLTDIGHHLIFPVVTSRDDLASFIDKTINITTRMIMKLRRVKP